MFMLSLASTSSTAPVEGATEQYRACTFAECKRGGCDAASAPFLCVDPLTAYMGCSAIGWDVASCADSCTMEACADAKPLASQASCKGIKCSADRCDPLTRYQRCGDDAPYQVNCPLSLSLLLALVTNGGNHCEWPVSVLKMPRVSRQP
jgi:hypothetical protein